jgi:hypothetical protein
MTSNHYSFAPKILFRNKYTQTILGSIVSGNTNLPECKLHKVLIDHKAQLVLFELQWPQDYSTAIQKAPIVPYDQLILYEVYILANSYFQKLLILE